MLEDETHELPLPRRIHPAPNPTTERKRGQHQHPGSSHQEILRHTIQQQKPRRVKSSQGREDLAVKRHSRRDDKSNKKPVLSHSQRTVRSSRRTLRVPPIFPLSNSIKLILPEEDYTIVQGKLQHLREAATQTNVAKLILNLLPRAKVTPGIASYDFNLLFRNGDNILDTFLDYGAIIMCVHDIDGTDATYSLITHHN